MSLHYDSIEQLPEHLQKQAKEKLGIVPVWVASKALTTTLPDIKDNEQYVGHITAKVVQNKEHESDFQKWVLKQLHDNGWRVHAERAAMTLKGYRTPIQGDAGFWDITAVRAPRFLVAELKSDSGQASPDQVEWLMQASKCPMIEAKIWSPKDRDEIMEAIK